MWLALLQYSLYCGGLWLNCNISWVWLYRSVVLLICLKTFILAPLFCKSFYCLGCSCHPKILSPLLYYMHQSCLLPLAHLSVYTLSLITQHEHWHSLHRLSLPPQGHCHPVKSPSSWMIHLKCYTHLLRLSSSYFDLYASYLLPCLPRILLPKTVGLLISSLLSSGTLESLFFCLMQKVVLNHDPMSESPFDIFPRWSGSDACGDSDSVGLEWGSGTTVFI